MGTRDLSDPRAYVDIQSVLSVLWIRKQTADANALIAQRGTVKGHKSLAYYLGEANALSDIIDWIEDYTDD